MATTDLEFDHLGVAVADLGQALAESAGLLGLTLLRGPYDDPIQQARVAFVGRVGEPTSVIELIAPLGEGSHVARLVKRQVGAYHVCYRTADLPATLTRLRGEGCLVVAEPTPAVAYGGRCIAWVYLPSRLLVELVAT